MDKVRQHSLFIPFAAVFVGGLFVYVYDSIFARFGDIFLYAFVFAVPFSMGIVASLLTPKEQPQRESYINAAYAIMIFFIVAVGAFTEGIVWWITLAPIALLIALIAVLLTNLLKLP